MLGIVNPKTFDWKSIPLDGCLKGNAMDAFFTLKLYHKFSDEIKSMGCEPLVAEVISPALDVFSTIEYAGMDIDLVELENLNKKLQEKCIETEDSLYAFKEVKKQINLGSNNDLVGVLYTNEDGFRLYPPDKTPAGAPSVSAPTLELLLTIIKEELIGRENAKVAKQG